MCQVVYNKMPLDPLLDELKDLKRLEKINFQDNFV